MELPWNDPRSNKFATTIGLITSSGSSGPNILACEWTHHLSYNPGLIAVSLGPTKTTARNIRHNQELGINICALDHQYFPVLWGDIAVMIMIKLNQIQINAREYEKY